MEKFIIYIVQNIFLVYSATKLVKVVITKNIFCTIYVMNFPLYL